MEHFASSAGSERRRRPRAVTAHQCRTNTTRCRVPKRTRQVSMPPGWCRLLAVVMVVVASLCASASLEESQGQFQPKEVLRVLDEAQGSLMADLEEYRNSTRRGSVEERAVESSSTIEGMPTRAQASGRYGSGGPSAREKPAKPKYPELMDGQKSVRLNIRVDLVLVGFQGDGGKLLDIPQKTLELWLEHLTSVVPHATVADHAPASSGQGIGLTEERNLRTPDRRSYKALSTSPSVFKDAVNESIFTPYAYLAMEIQQEPDSLQIITEIDPLDVAEMLGNVGGFWDLILILWPIFFVAATRESPTLKPRNLRKSVTRAAERAKNVTPTVVFPRPLKRTMSVDGGLSRRSIPASDTPVEVPYWENAPQSDKSSDNKQDV